MGAQLRRQTGILADSPTTWCHPSLGTSFGMIQGTNTVLSIRTGCCPHTQSDHQPRSPVQFNDIYRSYASLEAGDFLVQLGFLTSSELSSEDKSHYQGNLRVHGAYSQKGVDKIAVSATELGQLPYFKRAGWQLQACFLQLYGRTERKLWQAVATEDKWSFQLDPKHFSCIFSNNARR